MKNIMRKILAIVLVILLAGAGMAIVWLFVPEKKEDKPSSDFATEDSSTPEEIPEGAEVYSVTYLMSRKDGTVIEEIPEFLYTEYGSYPESYYEGGPLYVSALNGVVEENFQEVYWDIDDPWGDGSEEESEPWLIGTSTGWFVDPEDDCKEWGFRGWFLDPTCTIPYEYGFRYEGDITLYADIEIARWTKAY